MVDIKTAAGKSAGSNRYEISLYGEDGVYFVGEDDGAVILTKGISRHSIDEIVQALAPGLQEKIDAGAREAKSLNTEFATALGATLGAPITEQTSFAEHFPEAAAALRPHLETYRISGVLADTFSPEHREILERALERILVDPAMTMKYMDFLEEESVESPSEAIVDAGSIAQILAPHAPLPDGRDRPLRDLNDQKLFQLLTSMPDIYKIQDAIARSDSAEWEWIRFEINELIASDRGEETIDDVREQWRREGPPVDIKKLLEDVQREEEEEEEEEGQNKKDEGESS